MIGRPINVFAWCADCRHQHNATGRCQHWWCRCMIFVPDPRAEVIFLSYAEERHVMIA